MDAKHVEHSSRCSLDRRNGRGKFTSPHPVSVFALHHVPHSTKYFPRLSTKLPHSGSQAEAAFKAARSAGDVNRFEKYRLIFGDKIGKNIEEFQQMKYNNIEEWKRFKSEKQSVLNSLEYRPEFDKAFGNYEVRSWYIHNDRMIGERIDTSKSLEEQAHQAHELRNTYKQQARDMMSDRAEVDSLDITNPLLPFELF